MPRDYNNIPRVIKGIENAVETALTAGAVFVLGEAVLRCPVGKYPAGSGRVGGNLRSSLNYRVIPEDREAIIGTPVDYAPWVELGTSRMAAQPYLRPAIDENVDRIANLMREQYRRAIERGARG